MKRVLQDMSRSERVVFLVALPFLLIAFALSWLFDWYEHG